MPASVRIRAYASDPGFDYYTVRIAGMHHCDDCGGYRDVIYIDDPECNGVHAWWACGPCRGEGYTRAHDGPT